MGGTPARVAGVDGCRGGWLVVRASVRPFGVVSVVVDEDLAGVLAEVADGRLGTVAVDMPIGLSDRGPRSCDVAARARLGPRRASVFPAPARAVLSARDYGEALRRSRAVSGRGLSKQSWHLSPRIAELDARLARLPPGAAARVHETHPELAFAVLSGAPMRHPKRTAAGRRERLRVLGDLVARRWLRPAAVPSGAAGDDVLDAVVLAVRAAAWTDGTAPPVVLGGDERDALGQPKRIRG